MNKNRGVFDFEFEFICRTPKAELKSQEGKNYKVGANMSTDKKNLQGPGHDNKVWVTNNEVNTWLKK